MLHCLDLKPSPAARWLKNDLGESFVITVSQFPPLQSREHNKNYQRELSESSNELIDVKKLEHCLAYSKCFIIIIIISQIT